LRAGRGTVPTGPTRSSPPDACVNSAVSDAASFTQPLPDGTQIRISAARGAGRLEFLAEADRLGPSPTNSCPDHWRFRPGHETRFAHSIVRWQAVVLLARFSALPSWRSSSMRAYGSKGTGGLTSYNTRRCKSPLLSSAASAIAARSRAATASHGCRPSASRSAFLPRPGRGRTRPARSSFTLASWTLSSPRFRQRYGLIGCCFSAMAGGSPQACEGSASLSARSRPCPASSSYSQGRSSVTVVDAGPGCVFRQSDASRKEAARNLGRFTAHM